jgi:hypothetical protein
LKKNNNDKDNTKILRQRRLKKTIKRVYKFCVQVKPSKTLSNIVSELDVFAIFPANKSQLDSSDDGDEFLVGDNPDAHEILKHFISD